MSSPFSRTLRALEADGFRRATVAFCVGASLLAAWSLWFLFAHITVYEVSQSARLEVENAALPLVAEQWGRVATVDVALGDHVREGDTLLTLDTEDLFLQLDEARARQDAASVALDALQRSLDATRRAAVASDSARQAESAAAASAQERAKAEAALRAEEAARAADLGDAIPDAERGVATASASVTAATAREADSTLRRIRLSGGAGKEQDEAALAALEGQVEQRRSELEAAWVVVSRLELAIERAQIRAPALGVVAEMAALAPGAWVSQGMVLATVLPQGDLTVVASFAPADALGRIAAGQPATMRLDGFPWTQYGTLSTRVRAVAQEVRDGAVRVELTVEGGQQLPVQHALTGSVEVAVESRTPLQLLLRAAGRITTPSGG